MHTAQAARRRGLAAAMLRRIAMAARACGYLRLSLETGSQAYSAPARGFYRRCGFVECGPSAGYRPDRNSVFMTLDPRSP
jgi:putative acetyltransferase